MCELGRLGQEQVLDDDALHRREGFFDVLGIRIGLCEILALDVHGLELAAAGRIEHVRNTEPRFASDLNAPGPFELRPDRVIADGPVPG